MEIWEKNNIWPFLIHFMQSNASLIKKLMVHNDFARKNLYSVGRAKLSSTSVVILLLRLGMIFSMRRGQKRRFMISKSSLLRLGSKQDKCTKIPLEQRVEWCEPLCFWNLY